MTNQLRPTAASLVHPSSFRLHPSGAWHHDETSAGRGDRFDVCQQRGLRREPHDFRAMRLKESRTTFGHFN
jgi:hypothetical protein